MQEMCYDRALGFKIRRICHSSDVGNHNLMIAWVTTLTIEMIRARSDLEGYMEPCTRVSIARKTNYRGHCSDRTHHIHVCLVQNTSLTCVI